ncbi:hypothetical protein BH09PSE5_BH09PSE5_44560 [soil metagenome]
MRMGVSSKSRSGWLAAGLWAVAGGWSAGLLAPTPAAAQGTTVYRCPADPVRRTPVLYTDALSQKEATERGCKPIENAPVTVMETVKPRRPASSGVAASSPPGSRIDPSEQRARDSDSRRILESELAREQERLAAALREYKNGEPDRLGDERNYQKYLDRVADLKSSIDRRQSDIEAIKRELAKLQP